MNILVGIDFGESAHAISQAAAPPARMDVVTKLHFTIGLGARRQVQQHHRGRVIQVAVPRSGFTGNFFGLPRGIVARQQVGELERTLDPDTTGAERPLGACEPFATRSIVQVHEMRVREHERDSAERLARTGILAQHISTSSSRTRRVTQEWTKNNRRHTAADAFCARWAADSRSRA